MRDIILIDTNIIIGLEDNVQISPVFSEFIQYSISNNYMICYHPICLYDIHQDKDTIRRDIILSKFKKYKELENPANLSFSFSTKIGQKNRNDKVDNCQLYQVYKGYVALFVTEDVGILKKASRINLGNKVLSITDALEFIKKKFEFKIPSHPNIVSSSVRDIEHFEAVPFFNSLKSDYKEFSQWFSKCMRENRKCYYLTIDNKLSALLIYNLEKPNQHRIPEIYEDCLKMCSFKINENAFVLKIGELFLNKMLQLCIERNIKYLYLTVLEKYKFLIALLKKYGFKKRLFRPEGGTTEKLLIKDLNKEKIPKKDYNKFVSHPFYCDNLKYNKYIIPIVPEFYNTLFKDSNLRERSLFDIINVKDEIQGNSIEKAYICSKARKGMKTGDILFFYASRKSKSIHPVGILKETIQTKSFEKLSSKVRGKTVFSEHDLRIIFKELKQNVNILIFRLIYYLENPIYWDRLKTLKSSSTKFISITKLSEEDYIQIKKEAYFDKRYIIN
jgi:hypothetical protein